MSNKTPPQEQIFNKERLFDYVKQFSFPRLAGTEGEEKAVELTVDTFKIIGFKENQIETEPFKFSDFYSTTLIALIMSMSLLFVIMLIFFVYIYVFFTIIMILIMTIVVLLIIKGLKHPEKPGFWGEYFGDTLAATNVIVKIPAKTLPEEKAANIVISAHLDSKSQSLKTSWRIVLYRMWLFSGIFISALYFSVLIDILGNIKFNIILAEFDDGTKLRLNELAFIVLISLYSFSNFMLILLGTHNKSPGALDNASGMAIVFELSSYFKDHPLDNFNMWFCQFSAEELGTMGSRIFVNNHEDQFIKGRIFQINFDMVSSATHSPRRNRVEYLKSYGVLPRKKIAPILSKYLDKAAMQEKVRIKGFHLTTGAHLDSVPFHLRGYDAVDISTRGGAKWTHNRDDTPDKVDPKILLEACLIAQRTIFMLDNDYETLCTNQDIVCDDK